jgi:hypothetical protein
VHAPIVELSSGATGDPDCARHGVT